MRTTLLSLALAASLPAQNLITNGDFETGDLTGWTVAYGTPVVQVLPTNGGPPSFAVAHFEAPPCHQVQTAQVVQRIPIPVPGRYELRFDYLFAAAGAFGFGSVTAWVGNASFPAGYATPQTGVVRGQYSVAVNLQSPVDLQFDVIADDCGGAAVVDNVSVRRVRDARLGIFRSRILGFPTWIPAYGTPAALCYLLVGFAPAAAPLTIPGFTGDLRLDPLQTGVFAVRTLNASGTVRFYVTPPAKPALAGVDLYWQAAQLDLATGRGAFSWESLQPFWM